MALLRRVIGDALRARRQGQRRTLREVSTAANVSLGYLSEIERGQKEASSELLASICEALGSQLSELLREASDSLARTERADGVLVEAPLGDRQLSEGALAGSPVAPVGGEVPHARTGPPTPAALAAPAPAGLAPAEPDAAQRSLTDGQVSVSVRRDGPLRTILHAVRTRRPDQSVTRR
ncbi:MAG: helix-turn-helix domain-containing protein [Micromonosporaceae bacterium]|nr:helix-turn-helix domain-containing protein [Micromonosporaceae bacterium]